MQVCTAALTFARSREQGTFQKLTGVDYRVAERLPFTTHPRFRGGQYCLYRADALEELLREHGGMPGMCARLAKRRARPYGSGFAAMQSADSAQVLVLEARAAGRIRDALHASAHV